MSKTQKHLSMVVAVLAGLAVSAQAQWTLYDNSAAYMNKVHSAGTEFGDQITLGGLPAGIYPLTAFSFEYYTENFTPGPGKTVDLKLYANTGASISLGGQTYIAPGATPLFDSGPLALSSGPGGFKTVDISAPGGKIADVPNSFTWTVTFSGLGANEVAALPYYGPPSVGASGSGFWEKDAGGAWKYMQIDNGNTPANFASRAVAIPEPSTVQLLLLAGAGGLGFLAIRRRS